MKISELIEYVAADMLDDRKKLISGTSDRLFSDELIARHLADAERIMCRDGWVLEDISTPAVTHIKLVEGKGEYPLHPSILFVKSANLSDTDVDLIRTDYDGNRSPLSFDADRPWDITDPYIENNGRPRKFSTDMGTRIIRFRQRPDSDAALLKVYLKVVRMPVTAITVTNQSAPPEISEEFHMDLTLYAGGKCLQRPSVDLELRALGKSWINDFDEKVLKAKKDKKRLSQAAPRTYFSGRTNGNR